MNELKENTGYVELTVNPGPQTTAYVDTDPYERPLLKLLCPSRFELTIKPEGPGIEDHDIVAAERLAATAAQYLTMVQTMHHKLATDPEPHTARSQS